METYNQITHEEAEALQIVRGMLQKVIDPNRITVGDAKTYMSIMLDDRRFQPICRLYFRQNKYIGTISERKVETRTLIKCPEDIRMFSGDMERIVKKYLG